MAASEPILFSAQLAAIRPAQTQMASTWLRASQANLYSTGKGAGSSSEDDMLDAMMAGMDSDFSVPTPSTPAANASTSEASSSSAQSAASSQGSEDPAPTHVAAPVDIEKRLKALCKSCLRSGHSLMNGCA